MNTLEISTISILHTLSKLNSDELSMVLMIACGKTIDEMASIRGREVHETQLQVNSIVEKFQLPGISEMASMLGELNICSMFNEKHI